VLAALIIVFREVFEAGLIIGIVMVVTRGVHARGWWVSAGVAGGVLGACVAAAFAGALATAFSGTGQELFNAAILSLAVVMLTWHNVWMARHGRELAAEMRDVGAAVASGAKPLAALAVVIGVAVLREGVEVVLFLYGIAVSESSMSVFAGGLAGLALGAVVCLLAYFGLLRIPGRYLFGVTSVLLAFLAAGMASQAVAFLQQADMISTMSGTMWDSSWLLSNASLLGQALHTLIGYTAQPTALQLAVYFAVLVTIFVLMKVVGTGPAPTTKPVKAAR
jgi:high-affinity iron transporter